MPDHVVILILENHGENSVIGSSHALYINSIANDTNAAGFSQSYALTHPSQPNYLMLFSGSNQGVTNDDVPGVLPFKAANLGAALIAKSLKFAAYSEDLDSTGFMGATNKAYARKHAPWVNWQGTSVNGIPGSAHLDFGSFPTNYSLLPVISYVVPNLQHDMHDGTVAMGDAWVKANLDGYIQWAKTHNSLFILTFDEDENAGGTNLIPTIFLGPMVKKGIYAEHITHYNVLRTLEDMYGLTHSGAAATATAITDIWKTTTAARGDVTSVLLGGMSIRMLPSERTATFRFPPIRGQGAELEIRTATGTSVRRTHLEAGQDSLTWAYGRQSAGKFVVMLRQGRHRSSLGFSL